MAAAVFISHSAKDRQIAATICNALERRGFACWMAHRDVGPGENFQEAIVQAIMSARAMVLVFSANANNSSEIKKEVVLASQHNLVVIPVRVEDVLPSGAFAYELATRQMIDMFEDWERAVERLASRLSAILSIGPVPADAMPAARQPGGNGEPRKAAGSWPVPWTALGIAAAGIVALGVVGAAVYTGFPDRPARVPQSKGTVQEQPPPKKADVPLPSGALKRVVLRTVIQGKPISAVLARVAGDEWVWTENGANFNFKLLAESAAELLFHDASRDMYHRLDLKLRLNYWRPGISTTWYTHYNIISTE